MWDFGGKPGMAVPGGAWLVRISLLLAILLLLLACTLCSIMASEPEALDTDNLGGVLFHAASRGDLEQVALALDQGADVDRRSSRLYDWTALHTASWNGHEPVVRLLLDRRASINAMSKSDWTPLFIAALNGREAVVRLLLERKASVNATTKDNVTPLSISAKNGYEPIVRLLLDHGADTTIVSVRRGALLLLRPPLRSLDSQLPSVSATEHWRYRSTGCRNTITQATDSRSRCETLPPPIYCNRIDSYGIGIVVGIGIGIGVQLSHL